MLTVDPPVADTVPPLNPPPAKYQLPVEGASVNVPAGNTSPARLIVLPPQLNATPEIIRTDARFNTELDAEMVPAREYRPLGPVRKLAVELISDVKPPRVEGPLALTIRVASFSKIDPLLLLSTC